MPHHKRPADRNRRDRSPEGSPDVWVSVRSLYGYHGREPRVMLTMGDGKPMQFSSDEARRVARLLLEAAESAEQDAFLFEFSCSVLGTPEEQAAELLNIFREHRQKWMDPEL